MARARRNNESPQTTRLPPRLLSPFFLAGLRARERQRARVTGSLKAARATLLGTYCPPAGRRPPSAAAAFHPPKKHLSSSLQHLLLPLSHKKQTNQTKLQYKVVPCPNPEPHNWEQCMFAHYGEKARRRHPSKYRAVQCPEARAVSLFGFLGIVYAGGLLGLLCVLSLLPPALSYTHTRTTKQQTPTIKHSTKKRKRCARAARTAPARTRSSSTGCTPSGAYCCAVSVYCCVCLCCLRSVRLARVFPEVPVCPPHTQPTTRPHTLTPPQKNK